MNEKISNKLLAISIGFSFIIIALFCFFCIGLSRVDAKSYRWNTPLDINFTNDVFPNSNIVKTCNQANECWYSENGDFVSNYVQYRYRIFDNIENDDTQATLGSYTLKFRARIIGIDELTKNNLAIRLYYYPNSNNTYGVATCDSNQRYDLVYNNSSHTDVYVNYTCEVFEVTTNFTYFAISIGTTPNYIFGTQISTNLQLIGEGESTNSDIINNQNQNTDVIVNNQNQNTEDIINNQDKNTEDIINSNKETQDVIKDQFNDCRDSKNIINIKNVETGTKNGITLTYNNNTFKLVGTATGYTAFNIEINNISGLNAYSSTSWGSYGLFGQYNNTGVFSFYSNNTYNGNVNKLIIGINNGVTINKEFKLQIEKGSSFTSYENPGEICSNKIDETNDKLDGIQGAITDDSAPNLDAFNNMSGWLPPGPLDSIINIPLNVLNGLVGAFNNNTCSPISIPIPFVGGTLDLPCLYNLYSTINGLSIALTTFFTAISGYLMFKYLSNLYVWIDKTLKMEESSYMQDWGGV